MRSSSRGSFTGTVPLSTEELERRRTKEKEQRRILRIQQVREQEKKYALKLLEASKRQKKSQKDQILTDVKDEWEAQQRENISKLQQKIDTAISNVGAAQSDAYNFAQIQAREATQAYEQLLESRTEEAKRYDEAYQWLQASINERQAPKQQVVEWKSQVMKVEKERAKGKVAQMKAKQESDRLSQKENVVQEPTGPQVLNYKTVHSSTRVGVHFKATRYHESIQNELPESPAKKAPLPTPQESVYLLQENAFTTAIQIEQQDLMKAERDREEQQNKELLLKQRSKIAHSRLIAEKAGKEAEKALAQHVQEARRQKAHQIGEISRVVERRVVNGDNPVADTRLDTQFSQEDGTLALSWSCMSRERSTKSSRKDMLNRAFEEQFLNNAPQPMDHPDEASADLDIFSNFKDLHSPTSAVSTSLPPTVHSNVANTSNSSGSAKSTSITRAPQRKQTTLVSNPPKAVKTTQSSPKESSPQSNTPSLSSESTTTSFTLPPPLAFNSTSHTTQTDISELQQPARSEASTDTFSLTNEYNPHWYLLHPDNDSLSHYLEPTPSNEGEKYKHNQQEEEEEEKQEETEQSSNSSQQYPPLHFSYGLASEEYLRDFERKMRELDDHFHKALGLPASHSPSPSLSVSGSSIQSPLVSHLPSPRQLPTHQPYQSPTSYSTHQQADPDHHTRQESLQQPSPRQSSPLLPSAYLSPPSDDPSMPSPQSQPSHQSTPLNMPVTQAHHAHIQDSPHFQAIFKPTTKPSQNTSPPSASEYPVFTFVLDSPTRPTEHQSHSPRSPSPLYTGDEDVFAVSPLSTAVSSPTPLFPRSPTPPRSPFLSSSPLSNHSLSYSTDSLFMSL